MEAINPNLVWVDDICYRSYNPDISEIKTNPHIDEFEEDINMTSNNLNKPSNDLAIPTLALGFVIGKNAQNLKRIKANSSTKIKIVKNKDGTSKAIINGLNPQNIETAIQLLINSINKFKQIAKPTHFISIPLRSASFEQSFNEFKRLVLSQYGMAQGINESLFAIPNKIHLTICMLKIIEDIEIPKYTAFLNSFNEQTLKSLIGNVPLRLHLKGIEYMNDDPSSVDVLYCRIDPLSDLDRMQNIADSLVDGLVKEGLMERKTEKVKLHVTLMNSKWNEPHNSRESRKPNQRISFDARQILKDFAQFDFGVCEITSLHLSIRNEFGKDGYYKAAHIINL